MHQTQAPGTGEEQKVALNLTQKTNDVSEVEIDFANFKFVLYASFHDYTKSIGMELCEALEKYCNSRGLDNFKFTYALKEEGLGNSFWNYDYIVE